eukprot:scaffold54347_cov66-Phaeocystis_antarctica.AAC.2
MAVRDQGGARVGVGAGSAPLTCLTLRDIDALLKFAIEAGRAQGRDSRTCFTVAPLLARVANLLPLFILELAWDALLTLREVGVPRGACGVISLHRRNASRGARYRRYRAKGARVARLTVEAVVQARQAVATERADLALKFATAALELAALALVALLLPGGVLHGTWLALRALSAIRARRAIRARFLTGIGLVLASDALDACCHARVWGHRAGGTLDRISAAARAPSPCRALRALGHRLESMAAIVRPRGAGLHLGAHRLDGTIVAWRARAGAQRAVQPSVGAILARWALSHVGGERWAVVAPGANQALERARRAVPPALAGLALAELQLVAIVAGSALNWRGAALRARVAQRAWRARRLPRLVLVGPAGAVPALCLVCLVGERARGAEPALAVRNSGASGEAHANLYVGCLGRAELAAARAFAHVGGGGGTVGLHDRLHAARVGEVEQVAGAHQQLGRVKSHHHRRCVGKAAVSHEHLPLCCVDRSRDKGVRDIEVSVDAVHREGVSALQHAVHNVERAAIVVHQRMVGSEAPPPIQRLR